MADEEKKGADPVALAAFHKVDQAIIEFEKAAEVSYDGTAKFLAALVAVSFTTALSVAQNRQLAMAFGDVCKALIDKANAQAPTATQCSCSSCQAKRSDDGYGSKPPIAMTEEERSAHYGKLLNFMAKQPKDKDIN